MLGWLRWSEGALLLLAIRHVESGLHWCGGGRSVRCSGDLCFADGNVTLLATNNITTSTTACHFVVHKGLLARHSPVLQDIFKVLEATKPDSFQGPPIVPLPDAAEDLACFLTALYDGTSHLHYDITDFTSIAAILRLATKYKVKRLRQDMLAGMSIAWPRFLTQWEIREANATSPNGIYEPRKSLPHPILVIKLAREVNAPYLLPSAFYDLSRCYPSDTVSGYTCPKTHQTHFLSDSDLTNLLKGKEHTSRFLSTFIVNELEGRQPSLACVYKTEIDPLRKRNCQAAFEAITFEILRDVNGVVCHRSSDPLFAIMDAELMQTREDPTGRTDLTVRACEFCRAEFSTVVDAAREEFWRRLPQWFGLDVHPWP
ncbi:hypothetical protein AMATHDRAFT_73160 [Amanita thiersii Skay4041]|uniref:BTB domain-containing protein n=1 Tax=Amanita thiersii Skay4041 TaxID=703135 RepID=A0A2A9P033_9AGAR|nr:hypothetical protein AMATHDRAFT_73160 [Amanita thiersii Skay4041]